MRGATLFSVVSSLDIIAPTLFCENKLSTNVISESYLALSFGFLVRYGLTPHSSSCPLSNLNL
jgi:hypothetical protein